MNVKYEYIGVLRRPRMVENRLYGLRVHIMISINIKLISDPKSLLGKTCIRESSTTILLYEKIKND